ncbi:gas vesicle protein [Actinomycetospora sp. TBRC 11914]|nr:gas vesicle protein [Actinomycetospora sp. TBRC 11914]
MPATRQQQQAASPQPRNSGTDLADILERVLDKGIVIAGDIQINLLDIELLTIKLRLVVASVDRAKEMGIDWWERDPTLSSGHKELEEENRRLRERLETLERRGLPGSDEDDAELEGVPVDDDALEPADDEVEDAEVADDEPDDEPDDGVEAEDEPDEARARRGNGARRSAPRRRPARRTEGRR